MGKYVSLGTNGRYFILFRDGQTLWNGPSSMKPYFEGNIGIRCVAFGGNNDAFAVVYADGSCKFEGSKIPTALRKILNDRGRKDLICITMGPGGEWFVKVKGGEIWWGGLPKKTIGIFD